MPYNNASIPPTEEITGQTLLPLARVKKIIAVDDEIGAVSANATYAVTIATELFIRHFSEQAFNVMKAEKKPRRQMQYADIGKSDDPLTRSHSIEKGDAANAVSRVDNLSFLEDIVPKTTTVREYRSRKSRAAATEKAAALPNGQTVLDGSNRPVAQRSAPQSVQSAIPPEAMDVVPTDASASDPTRSLASRPQLTNGQQHLVFQHYEPGSSPRRDGSGDVEMS